MEKKTFDRKTILKICVSVLTGLLLVLLMDIDQFIAAYKMYGGYIPNYEISNVGISADTLDKIQGNTILRLYVSRYFLTVLPISIFFIVICFFKDNQYYLKDKSFFEDNPHMSSIVLILRWILGILIAGFILNFNRNMFNDTFHNCLIGRDEDFFRIIFAFFALTVFVIDPRKFFSSAKSLRRIHPKFYTFLFMLVVSYISCCLLEFQSASKMQFVSYMLFFNCLYWFLLQLFFLILLRRVKTVATISLIVSYAIGLANDIVYQFRGNYIMFGDLTVIRTAVEVVGNYTYSPTMWFFIALVLFIISLIIVRKLKEPELFTEKRELKKTAVSELVFIVLLVVSFNTGVLYHNVIGVHWDYNKCVAYVGYLPYFISNMSSNKDLTVEGYSADNIDSIIDEGIEDYEKEDVASSIVEPNIIMIQNEAFSDLSVTADIETDIDYMPFIHSLTENTQKGYLNMSITGGPTANTEFEVLGRSSLQYFPFGSIVFTQYLKQSIPSIVSVLKSQPNPYYTAAYHSYYSTGYNRTSAYSYLGFDEKVFENNYLKDYDSSELVRNLVSDETDYKKVIEMYEEHDDEPFFCFNVTMQNHGGYSGNNYEFEDPVTVTNWDATDSINTYLSLIKMSDSAFEGLVDYFKNVDEPTIIVMYGDHQPGFDDNSKEVLSLHPAWEDDTLQTLSNYYVPYVIWANYDIEEVDDMNLEGLNKLSTNFLSTKVLKIAGLNLSDYDKYLETIHEETPAITAIGVWDKNGDYYSNYTYAPNATELLNLDYVQYNMILDKNEKCWDRFNP